MLAYCSHYQKSGMGDSDDYLVYSDECSGINSVIAQIAKTSTAFQQKKTWHYGVSRTPVLDLLSNVWKSIEI